MAPTSTMWTQQDAVDVNNWALRADLELCGSIPPPTYAELHADAHLNTFDVSESGHAVLLSERGRLFLLNLFQPPSTKKTASSTQHQTRVRLAHLELDPPLQKDEIREIERVHVNAAGTSVLLAARSWIKVVRIPSEATQMLTNTSGTANGATLSALDAKRVLGTATRSNRQHFLVRFADGTTETVGVDVPKGGISQQDVEQAASRSKRIASVSREIYCASIRQVGYFNRVRHVAWHPLSDSHLVVLSDGEEISIFNLHHDVTKPEQRHVLYFPRRASSAGASVSTATSVSFCFGSPHMLWDVFTCYVLRSDGSIYALCPLVPYDSRVHASVLATLKSEVDGQLARTKKQIEALTSDDDLKGIYQTPTKYATRSTDSAVDTRRRLTSTVAELKSQKYWLEEAWAPVSVASAASTASLTSPMHKYTKHPIANAESNSDFYRCVKPHISGISPETWPLAIQGPVDVSPKSVIAGKHNVAGGSVASSVLSVPYSLKHSETMALNPFLLRSYTSGHVELVLLDAPVRPQWRSDDSASTRPLPALLLECLSLGVDDSGGRAVLTRDESDPRLVYCLHSTGVHVINVSWVFALAAGKPFTTLPKSSVRHIFSVSPSSSASEVSVKNVIGVRVIKNVYFGHLLLLRLASGSFEVVNVSAASSELLKGVLESSNLDVSFGDSQSSLPETLASVAASKAASASTSKNSGGKGGVRPFQDIVVEKLSALTARGTRVTGNTKLSEVNDEILAFVIDRIKTLYEDIEYIDVMDQLMKDRLVLDQEMLKTQAEKAVAVQREMKQAQDGLLALQEKVDRAMKAQQNLRKRAAAVLQAVKENQPMLSRAEREFKEELDLVSVEVRRMKPRVTQLTVSGQRLVRNLENLALSSASQTQLRPTGINAISDEKKQMCFDVLRAEAQLIDDAKSMIQDMQTNIQILQK